MHKALYREYRPLTFDDVIGQDHITKTLKNQIKENSLSHAYLFCGTRGTGKTSTAKILSRAVNCLDEKDKPCNKCSSCVSILDNSNIDVVEIDAASNNSVEDIRELRDKVKYTPNESKYKVYIIDEVHMLSQGAFNALLKTLEEPPEYVIFILATTEPNKIPATILSRCQRFDFKRVSMENLIRKMRFICDKENIEIDDDALKIVARNGQGSVRDSLSILDKCVSFGNGRITSDDVLELLGAADPSQLFDLGKSLINSELSHSIKMVDEYYMWGKDLKLLIEDLSNFFRGLMMVKVFGNADEQIDLSNEYKQHLIEISKIIDMNEIIRILNLLSELLDKLRNSTNQKTTIEIYFIKIASPQTDVNNDAILKRIENIEKIVEDSKFNLSLDIDGKIKEKIEQISSLNLENFDIKKERTKNTEVKDANTSSQENNISDIINDDDSDGVQLDLDKLKEYIKSKRMPKENAAADAFVRIECINDTVYALLKDEHVFLIDAIEREGSDLKKNIRKAIKETFGIDAKLKACSLSEFPKIYSTANEENSTLNEGIKLLEDNLVKNVVIEEE